jgi:hypothetical protein
MEVGGVWIRFSRAATFFQLQLGLQHQFVCPHLSVQFGDDAECLFVRSSILARASSGFFSRTNGRLDLLLFLGMRESTSSGSGTSDAEKALGRIWRRTTFDFDFEVPKRHVITGCCSLSGFFSHLLLLAWFAVSFAFRPLLCISLLVKPVKALAAKARPCGLRLS